MLTQNKKVVLQIEGKEQHDWSAYDVDSDFLIPADGFSVELSIAASRKPLQQWVGKECRLLIDNETVLTGIIGTQRCDKQKGQRSLRLTGRDLAALLVDCSAKPLNVQGLTVLDAVKKLLEPFKQIKKVVLKAEENPVLNRIDIEQGQNVWEVAKKLVNSVGLHIWCDADGTLIVGGADYNSPPVATLCWSHQDNRRNVQNVEIEYDADATFSEVTFLAQSHAKRGNAAQHDLKWVYRDPNVSFYKPKTVVIADADSLTNLQKLAKKQLSDWKLESLTITIEVSGHHTSDGTLWQAGQRVHYIDDEEGIDAIFFIMGRRFTFSRQSGTKTQLRLKEDGVWTPDAYPEQAKKARQRRGKKKNAQMGNESKEFQS